MSSADLAPECLPLDRRITHPWEVLESWGPFQDQDVVDVGCGLGDLVRWFQDQGARALGVDRPEMLIKARQSGPGSFLEGGGEALPLGDASVDKVLFFASLHHVPEGLVGRALEESARVLRPGGGLMVVEPVPVPDSFYELTRLVEEESHRFEEVLQALASTRLFRSCGREGAHFCRTLGHFQGLLECYVDDAVRRSELLERAGPLFERLAPSAKGAWLPSCIRIDVLVKA